MERLTERNPLWIDDEMWERACEPDCEEIDAVYRKLKEYVIPSIRKTGTYSMAKYQPKATSVGEVANLLKILERTMKAEKQSPEVIAKNIERVCRQFGIELSEDFTKRNDNGQMAFVIVGVK